MSVELFTNNRRTRDQLKTASAGGLNMGLHNIIHRNCSKVFPIQNNSGNSLKQK